MRKPCWRGKTSPANTTPFADLPVGPEGPPGRQIRKESIFALGWQANLRKNAPRAVHAGAADYTEGGCGPLQIPQERKASSVNVVLLFMRKPCTGPEIVLRRAL